ncbi:DUF6881 domain-containing protein [Streptomyces solicavernae]|uniref:DUF6881 domain-containing protein n=1 Tax=Streptomyces solicavernae TaxID=3043614 RepID=UPI0032B77502
MTFDHDAAGRELTRRVGDALSVTQMYDPLGRLTAQTVTGAGGGAGADTPVQHRSYGYRADGHLTRIDDQLNGTRHFDLDAVGIHDFSEEPTVVYCEVGDDGYETRKVQEYRDGLALKAKADAQHESGRIGLSDIPVGSIDDVAAQSEFSTFLIEPDDFEGVWRGARWPGAY